MDLIQGVDYAGRKCTLVHEGTLVPVKQGEVVQTFRGESIAISGGYPPRKPGSTGRVWSDSDEVFPSVCNLAWAVES